MVQLLKEKKRGGRNPVAKKSSPGKTIFFKSYKGEIRKKKNFPGQVSRQKGMGLSLDLVPLNYYGNKTALIMKQGKPRLHYQNSKEYSAYTKEILKITELSRYY